MKHYFKCGVCDHKQNCDNPEDIHQFDIDIRHMIDHYRSEHAKLFGKHITKYGFNADYWEFGPIPDDIGFSFIDGEDIHDFAALKNYL